MQDYRILRAHPNPVCSKVVCLYHESRENLAPGVPIFLQIVVSLALMQLMMLGVLGIKRFPYSSMLIPLPIITLVFYISATAMFNRPLEVRWCCRCTVLLMRLVASARGCLRTCVCAARDWCCTWL